VLGDGAVSGKTENGTRTFIGIPYAAPPVGDLRWKPPAKVEPWNGVLDATGPGVACMMGTGPDPTVQSSEDCLQLNVFAPDPAPDEPVPVMVWLHGGGHVNGSANAHLLPSLPMFFDGAALRSSSGQQVVVVTINYRLSSLGFLAHPALTDEQGTSGNYGLKDQQAALRWVQRNIEAFGGDPGDVTLFGESAGAYDTCYQLVAKGHEGLFERAILESGSCVGGHIKTLSEGEADGEALAQRVGCAQSEPAALLGCLRAKPAGELLPTDPDPAPGGFLFISPERGVPMSNGARDPGLFAVIDGDFLIEQPITSLEAGRFEHVPMIIGTNAREAAYFLNGETAFGDQDQFMQGLKDTFGPGAALVADRYPVANYDSANEAGIAVGTDFLFACPTRTLARLVTPYADVFVYTWNRGAAFGPFAGLGAAPHAVELAWVWDWWTTAFGKPVDEVALAHQVGGYWTGLAARGDPNAADRVTWPRYAPANGPELVFDLDITTEEGRSTEACDFWTQFNVPE
jgi:para-nitrobenzyl esterase